MKTQPSVNLSLRHPGGASTHKQPERSLECLTLQQDCKRHWKPPQKSPGRGIFIDFISLFIGPNCVTLRFIFQIIHLSPWSHIYLCYSRTVFFDVSNLIYNKSENITINDQILPAPQHCCDLVSFFSPHSREALMFHDHRHASSLRQRRH